MPGHPGNVQSSQGSFTKSEQATTCQPTNVKQPALRITGPRRAQAVPRMPLAGPSPICSLSSTARVPNLLCVDPPENESYAPFSHKHMHSLHKILHHFRGSYLFKGPLIELLRPEVEKPYLNSLQDDGPWPWGHGGQRLRDAGFKRRGPLPFAPGSPLPRTLPCPAHPWGHGLRGAVSRLQAPAQPL